MTAITGIEDRQVHPWPGLAAYGPEDAANFFGREDEVAALAQRINESVQVTVFGPSGTGKTSMLRAGVLPQLADRDFLAVYIRLDHSPAAPPYAVQARQALDAQVKAGGLEVEATGKPTRPDHEESLWEYLHRCEFWSPRNRLVRPVLVFDQFEEVFTLGQTASVAQGLITQLGDLCSNTVPRDVESFLGQSGQRVGYPIDTQNYRLVLCLREDFLARLEEIAVNVPALRRNRFGIRAMSGLQALAAVIGPGRHLLDDPVARQIVAIVGNSHRNDGPPLVDEELGRLSVEPALLSLFCRELNSRRLTRGEARITLEHVSQSGSDILQSFYDNAMAGVTPPTRAFVEDRLLTASGFRSAVALEDVTALGVPVNQIQSLVEQRILRIDERQGVRWVEFTHDILTGVARESRRRRIQEQREAAIRLQGRRRTRQVALISIGATLIVSAVLGSWWLEYHRTRQEMVRYYNKWTTRYGLAEGVGELTPDQVRHRSVSFKLIRYGSTNPVTRVVAVDSQGNPTAKHGLSTYLRERGDSSSSARECQWEFILDSSSRAPVYEKAIDRSGKLVWGLIYSPVRLGNKVKASFVGPDGFPQAQAQNGSMAEYVEIEYGTEGFEQRRTYMDRQGRPMPGPDRAYGQFQKCDGRGQVVYLASLGPPDKDGNRQKVIDDKGNSVEEFEYDVLGNDVSSKALDVADRPTYLIEGTAGARRDYDRFGRLTHVQYLDLNQRPCHDNGGVSAYAFAYDDRGNEIGLTCLDTNGKPCRHKEGYYGWSTEFDDRGNQTKCTFLGIDGRPCALNDGYAIIRNSYDERGDQIEWACFDAQDLPVVDKSLGIHKSVRRYNQGGKMTESHYFGVDGKPCALKDGYAAIRMTYDERGNRIELACFDTQDRPAVNKADGTYKTVRAYDERGNVTEAHYFGADGTPCARKDGYAAIRIKYDERGNQVEWACFDTLDRPAVDTTNDSHKVINAYNERGKIIQSRYFGTDDKPCKLPDGYAAIQMAYDERGDIIETHCTGVDGRPCSLKNGNAITHMVYDQWGNRIEQAHLDASGRPTINKSEGAYKTAKQYNQWGQVTEVRYFGVDGTPCSYKDGYAVFRATYDLRGNEVETAFFDVHGLPAVNNADGTHKTVKIYDSLGQVVEERFFGTDGKPCTHKDGFAILRAKYDQRGNQVEWACFDTQDRPTVDKSDGSHKTAKAYNDQGEVIEENYLGIDGKPFALKDGYATVRSKYDQHGNEIERAYFDERGQPSVNKSLGAHARRSIFNSLGKIIDETYFGVDGNPCAVKDGYVTIRMKYDERGNVIEWACFDAQDQPAVDKSVGNHKVAKAYDWQGNLTEASDFDVDGNPCTLRDGFATVRIKYDERGNEIERARFDAQGRPAVSKSDGMHKTVKVYDQFGKVIDERFFGIDGKPCPQTDGYCGTTSDYDDQGNRTRVTTLGADGKPLALKDGYATIRMKYNERGNQVEWACFDAQDRPTVDLSDGTHKTVKAYDAHGKNIEERYFGVDGNPCPDNEGYFGKSADFDDQGNQTRITFLGADAKPNALKDGYATIRTKYDTRGNETDRAYFDERDKPIVAKAIECHARHRVYNDQGKIAEETFIGVDGQPCLLKDGYATTRVKYDERGNVIEWACFDAQGRPTVDTSVGNHKVVKSYDQQNRVIERSDFGIDDKPCATLDGYSITRMKYDERGNETEVAHFDTQGRPTVNKSDGLHKTVKEYDQLGRVIKELYFGVDGSPCPEKDGDYGVSVDFDDRGNRTRLTTLGSDGKPVALKNGYATIRTKYNQNGKQVEWACFDAEDRPTVDLSDGTHKTVKAYDQRGKVIEELYFGVDGRPCQNSDGYFGKSADFDEQGNQTRFTILGFDGNPDSRKEGYATIRTKYDSRGNETDRAYFDERDQPIVSKAIECHARHRVYNDQAKITEETFFDIDGKPCALKDGYATTRMKYDQRGNVTEWACFDVQGRPTVDTSVGNHKVVKVYDQQNRVIESTDYGVDGEPCAARDGYVTLRMKYDQRGNEIERARFDAQGRPTVTQSDGTHKTIKMYDGRDRVVGERYIGVDGNPCPRKSGDFGWSANLDDQGNRTRMTTLGPDGKPMALKNGYATVRAKYDDRGNQVEWACYDVQDQPTVDLSDGTHKTVKAFNERGKIIEERYFGTDGSPCQNTDGYFGKSADFDEQGNQTRLTILGIDGKPSSLKTGYATIRLKYDQRGNEIERAYFGDRDQPIVAESIGCHARKSVCNAQGKVIEQRYFGIDGKPSPQPDGYYGLVVDFDAHGNRTRFTTLGIDDKPIALKDGYATVLTIYDEHDNQVEWACFDAQGRPTVDLSDGTHKTVKAFDQKGKAIDERYFGTDGKPCPNKDGFSVIHMRYDEQGNLTEWACFDTQDRPAVDASVGNHKLIKSYDDQGHVIEQRYFGNDGRPCMTLQGYSIIRVKYDQSGNPTEKTFFDTQGRPVTVRQGPG